MEHVSSPWCHQDCITDEPLHCGHGTKRTHDYGRDAEGNYLCYACCHLAEIAFMDAAYEKEDRYCGYLNLDGTMFTDWPGGKLGTVTRLGKRHNFSRDRHYITVQDIKGRFWYGTGAEGMYAIVRPMKT